jgi:tRNA (mo5U34)-methyltransferase
MSLQSTGQASLTREVEELGPWFHNLHLPDGVQTAPDHPLGDFPAFKWAILADVLPVDMHGWRALDIGCNAGFYSFELAKRGAQVLAIDHDEHYLKQAEWARDRFGLHDQVEFRQMGVYELRSLRATFDLVLFMGVLYHLRYPMLALDIATECVHGTLVVQTLTMPGPEPVPLPEDLAIDQRDMLRSPEWPAMAFIENRLAGDPTNWWAPNVAAVEAMIRTTGMEIVERAGHELWICRRGAANPHRQELAEATEQRG